MRPARSTPRDAAGESPAPGLDPQRAAGLDRLTSWTARALDATVAAAVLVRGEDALVASASDRELAAAHPQLLELARRVVAGGRARSSAGRPAATAALAGAPLAGRDGARSAAWRCSTSPRGASAT